MQSADFLALTNKDVYTTHADTAECAICTSGTHNLTHPNRRRKSAEKNWLAEFAALFYPPKHLLIFE